jgi:hypothetical protein
MSTPLPDPRSGITPAQTAELRAAASHVGTVAAITEELSRIAAREQALRARLTVARTTCQQDNDLRRNVPAPAAEQMRATAGSSLASAEDAMRRDLLRLPAGVPIITLCGRIPLRNIWIISDTQEAP